MERDFEIEYTYKGTIYLEAESESEALERAKEILEEQHGNRISDFAEFEVKREGAL